MFKRKIFRKIKRFFKFWWQRKTRGFDDSETWDLGDTTFFNWIHPRLVRFKELKNGWPAGIHPESTCEDSKDKESEELWNNILQEMIDLSYYFITEDDIHFAHPEKTERWNYLWKKYQLCLWW
jgi:hypothetical protein